MDGEPALACFAVAFAQIFPRFVHRLDDGIEGDLSRAVQDVRKLGGIEGAHRGDGVAFDAGDLHEPAHGIAGAPELMFEGTFGGVFRLHKRVTLEAAEDRCRHAGRGADLRLAARLGAAHGGIVLDDVAHHPRRGKRSENSVFGQVVLFLKMI